MQFTRLLRILKIYALTILFLSLASITSAKNLFSNKSQNQKSNIVSVKSSENNEEFLTSFLQSGEKTLQLPQSSELMDSFDKYLAIKMLLDLGRFFIRNFHNHETYMTYNKCIGSIKDSLPTFETHLKHFWSEMHRISKNEDATELKNKDVVLNIFKKLQEKNVKLENPKAEKKCKSVLIIQPKILRRDLNTILTRDQYFGGLASMRQKPFIDSMFSVYRQHLPPNAFELLNKSSRGLASFKINSQGLTDIAVATPAELKRARGAKRPLYGIDRNFTSKASLNKTLNNTRKMPMFNSTNIDFPGEPSANLENIEVSFDPRLTQNNTVTKSQKIHVLNSQNINFPGGPAANLQNVEVSLNHKLAAKNIVIDRKITYPKSVEKAVNNELSDSNLIPGLNGKVLSKTENASGQEEIYVNIRAEAENGANESNEESSAAVNNNVNSNSIVNNNSGQQSTEIPNAGEIGVNEESNI